MPGLTLRIGTAAERILSCVISAGEIKRHKIRSFLPDMSKNGYYKAYQSLLDAEYIKETVHAWKGYGSSGYKGVYVSATTAGRNAFAKIYGSDYMKSISPNMSGKANFDRQSKANDVNALLASCDMAYAQGEKPTLEEYLSVSCGEEYIKDSMNHGIAYSSREIKDYLRLNHLSGGTNIPFDSASGSRFHCILFYHRAVFVIYNTGAKAMLWSSVTERRLKSVICKLINDSELCDSGLTRRENESSLRCILLCTRKTGLYNILMGRGYKAIGSEKKQGNGKRGSLTIETLVKDYTSAAIVTTGNTQREQFLNALTFCSPAARAAYADKIIALYPEFSYLPNTNRLLFSDGGVRYLALPFIDAQALLIYKNYSSPMNYCVPAGTQNVIRAFVGDKATAFYDAETMQKLDIRTNI